MFRLLTFLIACFLILIFLAIKWSTIILATLIDNIFTNVVSSRYIQPSIIYCDLSDHLPIYVQSKQLVETNAVNCMFRRTHNETIKNKFLLNLQLTDWEVAMNETTIHKMYSAFINKLSAICDQSFPLIKVNNKCRTLPRKPIG